MKINKRLKIAPNQVLRYATLRSTVAAEKGDHIILSARCIARSLNSLRQWTHLQQIQKYAQSLTYFKHIIDYSNGAEQCLDNCYPLSQEKPQKISISTVNPSTIERSQHSLTYLRKFLHSLLRNALQQKYPSAYAYLAWNECQTAHIHCQSEEAYLIR